MAVDDALDAHESGKAVVASRNPFRETGPPACMAKLIMLRHKMDQSNARKHRRGSNQARQVSRPYNFTSARPRWMRFGKPFGKQYH
ncbi:hypothetical protein PLICRDRAFT_97874 [Plicaturopsis crispa FD-325 SS-3]|nr:hypothetical protein PLICRDRAFT_97874 [Plicaturopsis crispa FD-325 SS-3]